MLALTIQYYHYCLICLIYVSVYFTTHTFYQVLQCPSKLGDRPVLVSALQSRRVSSVLSKHLAID